MNVKQKEGSLFCAANKNQQLELWKTKMIKEFEKTLKQGFTFFEEMLACSPEDGDPFEATEYCDLKFEHSAFLGDR